MRLPAFFIPTSAIFLVVFKSPFEHSGENMVKLYHIQCLNEHLKVHIFGHLIL